MEEYPTQEDTVLLLLERVGEAQRLATMVLKEKDSGEIGGIGIGFDEAPAFSRPRLSKWLPSNFDATSVRMAVFHH